jgi:uncharacterized protein
VTVLHPGLRQRARAVVLDDADRAEVDLLLGADPIVNAVVAARVRAVDSLRPSRLGGVLVGVRDAGGLTACCFSGGNLVPIGGGPDAWALLAQFVSQQRRVCTSIVGRADAVEAMWSVLAKHWSPARSVRPRQPLLVCDGSLTVVPDPEVRPATLAELERYVPASAAMFAEELGVSPHVAPGTVPFRARVTELIKDGRALARYDRRGQVIFKAEIGAVSAHTAQVQGVWVRPDLRRRGIGTAAMAAVIAHAATLAPTVSLYVNEYNVAGRRMYDRLGMRGVSTLATVLF